MRNTTIIRNAENELIVHGIIKEGQKIMTKNAWRKIGYKVLDDEKPVTQLYLSIFAPKTEFRNGKPVMVKRFLTIYTRFYTKDQVTEIKRRHKVLVCPEPEMPLAA